MPAHCGEVTSESALKEWEGGSVVPDLCLVRDLKFPCRVYLLRCAPQEDGSPFTWYEGLVPNAKGCHFTRVRRPIAVELVWSVVYFALVEKRVGAGGN